YHISDTLVFFLMLPPQPSSTLFPYTTLFRSKFLLGTGCRIGEAIGIRWEDVDFEKRIISINHSLVYYSTEYKEHPMCTFSISLRSEEHTSELQSRFDLVCRLLLEKKKEKPKE